jgi:PAS domain S-box-containing protein
MKRGATDYVLKDRLNRLVPVIKRALQERAERMALHRAEQDLDETRSRLDRILASLVDVVWSVSASPPKFLYLNEAAEDVYGRPSAEFFADSHLWLDAVYSEDRPRVSAAWARALKGEPFDTEYRILKPDGKQRWIHNRAAPVRDDDGCVIRIDGLARDVTERRNHEEKIARLSRVRAVLSGIDAAIVRTKDKQQLYDDACHIAVSHGGFKLAWIGEVDPATLKVEPRASRGDHDGFLDCTRISAQEGDPNAGGLLGLAVRGGKALTSNDLAHDERLPAPEEELRRGYKSVAVLPLKTGDRVTALLALYAGELEFFDDEEMRLLEELAGTDRTSQPDAVS